MRWPSLSRSPGSRCSPQLRCARPVPLPLRGPPCAAVARCLCRRSDAHAAFCSRIPPARAAYAGALWPHCAVRCSLVLPAARASPCALLRGFRCSGRVGGVGRSFVAAARPFSPRRRLRLLPPFSPSGAGAPPVRNFIRGDKGFALGPASRSLRAVPAPCFAACSVGGSAVLRGLRPLPRRVRARCAARPRRLVASLRSLPLPLRGRR